MKLGLIQGRLTNPKWGFQDCPKDWQSEFNLLPSLGLSHIEWIVTRDSFYNNPIFFENVNQHSISSICADNIVSEMITNYDFLNHNLTPICEAAIRNNIKYVTIPLLEDSSIENQTKFSEFCNVFPKICDKFSSILFSLETELSIEKVSKLLTISNNICLTYDTGNTTSYGVSHKDYINLFNKKISNVHIKDRKKTGESMIPGTGDTNFKEIFNLLLQKGYSRSFTLQTAREEPNQEYSTIQKHSKIIRRIYEKCTQSV